MQPVHNATAKLMKTRSIANYAVATLISLALLIDSKALIRKFCSIFKEWGLSGRCKPWFVVEDEGIEPVVICRFLSMISRAFFIFPDSAVDGGGTKVARGSGRTGRLGTRLVLKSIELFAANWFPSAFWTDENLAKWLGVGELITRSLLAVVFPAKLNHEELITLYEWS